MLRFKRGPDRRVESVRVAHERRLHARSRRDMGLRWVALFRGADESQVIEAIGDSEILLLECDETLLQSGETNDSVFLILSGELGAYLDGSSEGKVFPLLPGECLGELSVIDGKPVSVLVKAMVETRVVQLSQDVFWNRLMAVPGVARNLLVVLAERMRRNTEFMLEGQRRQLELEHLRQELDVAQQLQVGMLPTRGQMFPERHDIEIAGMMEAASSVGGDLFDAFFIDENRLFLCIGDVSGHGIPAALFMARTVSLLRIAAFSMGQPDVLLASVNQQLCIGNDANMFVTLFCGFLAIDTGRLVYSNGGHPAPILWRDRATGNLPIPRGIALGVIPEARYLRSEIVLDPGEALLCFTDGVTEAQTAAGVEFSVPRLLELLAGAVDPSLETVLNRVRTAVAEFSGDLRLADDCTMLALRRPLQ